MMEFEPVYIERFVSDSLGFKLNEIFKQMPTEKRFIETTSLSKGIFIWKIFREIPAHGIDEIEEQARNFINNLDDEENKSLYSSELCSFIELLKYYRKVQSGKISPQLDDMYNYKTEFYRHNYDENEDYILYLDITRLMPHSNKKNDYFYNVVDADGEINSRNLSATLRIPERLIPDGNPESLVRKMVKVSCDTVHPYCLSAKDIIVLGSSMYDKTILKWKMEYKHALRNCKEHVAPTSINKIGLIVPLPSQAEKDFRAIFDKFNIPQDSIVIPDNLKRRCSKFNSRVEQISSAITEAEKDCDIICLIRGGGDLEDFLYFSNPEIFTKLILSSRYIVTGVGHADDEPLCQMVADYAAITPTDAAYHIANMIQPIFADSIDEKLDKIEQSIQHLNDLISMDNSTELLNDINNKLTHLTKN